MKYNEIIIKDVKRKEKLFSYLKRYGFSKNYINNLRKKEGYILVDGKIAYLDNFVKVGQRVQLCASPNAKTNIVPTNIPLEIVYEDDDLLLINKPSGLATMPTKSHFKDNLCGAILNYMLPKDFNFTVRIVGRLDKDTAGIVAVAKHSTACRYYSQSGIIQKTYYAIASGKIENDVLVDKPIATTNNKLGYNNLKREINDFGKQAQTFIMPIAYYDNNTLCKVEIKQGRTHQIRLHLASIGHPLVGDSVYGTPSNQISHTALICKQVNLRLINGQQKTFSVDYPEDFKKIFKGI